VLPWFVLALFLSQQSAVLLPAEPTAAALFNAYRQRQFAAFTAELARVQDFGELRKQIAREGKAWPPEAKAAFLLETADAALQRKPLTVRTGPEVDLFEDACKAVRQLPPQGQFEAAWHAAALSVLSARYASGTSIDDHLKHIRGRFDEGRLALIRAMPGERNAWYEATQVQSTLPKSGPEPMEGFLPSRSRMGRADMRDVVKLFEAARRFESVRAEATVRQAALLATWGQHAEALPLLAMIERLSDDPWLRYMAALMTGRSLEALGRRNDALLAYRAAVNLHVNGKAARLALASMVFGAGEREEADRLVSEALSEHPGPPDPWKEFLGGDFRLLEARRAAMREQLR
jgi:tetratricopeptide (TPR) repeat protein